jgi:predicted alpha/beta-hydrolase family hydrolase
VHYMSSASPAPKLLTDGLTRAQSTIVLAHGAGAGMDTYLWMLLRKGSANCCLDFGELATVRPTSAFWRTSEFEGKSPASNRPGR